MAATLMSGWSRGWPRRTGEQALPSLNLADRKAPAPDGHDTDYVTPGDVLAELREDNKLLTEMLREIHDLSSDNNDVTTATLLENWIDEAEQRTWFLIEITREQR
jgi:starvation-inducible DNA-binding protein